MNSSGSMDRNSKQYSLINNEEDIQEDSTTFQNGDSTDHKDQGIAVC